MRGPSGRALSTGNVTGEVAINPLGEVDTDDSDGTGSITVGRCKLNRVETSVESAWCQRLKHLIRCTSFKLCF